MLRRKLIDLSKGGKMSDTLSFSGTKSKTATTAADPSLLAAPPMHSTLTPTEEAWLERLGLQGGSGNPTIPV
ncbi:MAG: hypothetical protein FJ125_12245, partial [Deltaproteobacteria bacterium]|nr:hypothetical protein [Deltaproteobacteria bacterium]